MKFDTDCIQIAIRKFGLGLILLSFIWVLGAPSAYGKKLEKQWWYKIQSSNFTMYSVLDVEESKAIVRDLELLRAVIPKLTDK